MTSNNPRVALEELLKARFPESEHRSFKGRGGIDLTYIEDETLMDRLDEVLGVGNWNTQTELVDIDRGIVKVTLTGTLPGAVPPLHPNEGPSSFTFQDFGYPTNPGGEALKEAVTDGFRRVVRYLGPGRYVYAGDAPAKSAQPVARSVSTTANISKGHSVVKPTPTETAAPKIDALIGTPVARPATPKQKALLFATARDKGLAEADLKTLVLNMTGKHSSKDLSTHDIDNLLAFLNEVAAKVQEAD